MKAQYFGPKMKAMLIASSPDDVTGREGCGVELITGADYAAARALERRELGHVTGPGGFLPGMYWNNGGGLQCRADLTGDAFESDEP